MNMIKSLRHFGFAGVVLLVSLAAVGRSVPAQDCPSDITGDGEVDAADLGSILADWGVCAPAVTSVTPQHGSTLGGTLISISGVRIDTTTAVNIGGVACTSVQVLSPTLVTAVTPAGEVGDGAITLISPSGVSLAPMPFSYVLQAISSVTPSQGFYGGGTAITITGSYLSGATSVRVGGVPATSVVAVDANTVTAVTPAGSVGAATVEVTTPKGTASASAAFTFYACTTPAWATLIEELPNPAVVTDEPLRIRIIATRLAWRVLDTGTNIEMVLVPPGTFSMGEARWANPVHEVTLTNAFYIGRYEVTQSQWQAAMGWNPSQFASYGDSPSRPVEKVSWNTIQGFLTATGMRLPTEAEWEYSYRAGTTTAFHSGPGYPNGTNDDSFVPQIAWYSYNSGNQTHAVGGKAGNGLGIHDMAGNVAEWVNDWLSWYTSDAQTNPTGATTGLYRVYRGGAWNYDADYVRSSYRNANTPDYSYNNLGFRVARNPF